jgi:RNA polymerase sigma factor (sigma-70 family)
MFGRNGSRGGSQQGAQEAQVDPDRDDAARLRQGDAAGLAGLMARHQDRLFRYLLRLAGDESVAEDLFQQTWLHAAERIGRYDATRPFAPWLFTVAHHLALDHRRRRRPESLEEIDEPCAGPDVAADPLVQVALRERSTRVLAALAELSVLDREVLTLRFEQELELPALAGVLGVGVSTAKARLYRALARLRDRLLAQGPAGDWT